MFDPSTTFTLANMGTPLMWAIGCHLLFANALIGVLEGSLLHRWYAVPRGRAIGTMILANYVSAWLGVYLIGPVASRLHETLFPQSTLLSGLWVLFLLILVTFLITVLIEWPFVWSCFVGQPLATTRSIGANIRVQPVSYALLCALFFLVSRFSIFTAVHSDPTLKFVKQDQDLWVYYIRADDGNLWRVRLDGTSGEVVRQLNLPPAPRVSHSLMPPAPIYASPTDDGRWDLRLDRSGNVVDDTLLPSFASAAGASNEYRGSWGPLCHWPADMRAAADRPWSVHAPYFATDGLRFTATTGRPPIDGSLAFATPWEQWVARAPTITPHGFVVFQLGNRRIAILDPQTKAIGLLAVGYCPVVARD